MRHLVFAFLIGLLFTAEQKDYPALWWQPVSEKGKPDWEILPQEARFPEVILSKRHELGIFSNFAPTAIQFRGKKFGSIEGLWQSMLYPESTEDERAKFPGLMWKYKREQVEAMTAFEAKAAGDLAFANMKTMGINWVTFEGKRVTYYTPEKGDHYKIIVEAMREKLKQHPKVKELLLKTKGLTLRPDHHQEPDAPPAWKYYQIWMELRDELMR